MLRSDVDNVQLILSNFLDDLCSNHWNGPIKNNSHGITSSRAKRANIRAEIASSCTNNMAWSTRLQTLPIKVQMLPPNQTRAMTRTHLQNITSNTTVSKVMQYMRPSFWDITSQSSCSINVFFAIIVFGVASESCVPKVFCFPLLWVYYFFILF